MTSAPRRSAARVPSVARGDQAVVGARSASTPRRPPAGRSRSRATARSDDRAVLEPRRRRPCGSRRRARGPASGLQHLEERFDSGPELTDVLHRVVGVHAQHGDTGVRARRAPRRSPRSGRARRTAGRSAGCRRRSYSRASRTTSSRRPGFGGEAGAVDVEVLLGDIVEQAVHAGRVLGHELLVVARARAELLADDDAAGLLDEVVDLPVGDASSGLPVTSTRGASAGSHTVPAAIRASSSSAILLTICVKRGTSS